MKRSGTGTARREGRSAQTAGLSARGACCCWLLGAALGTHLLCSWIGTLDFSGARFFSYFRHPAVFLLNLLPVVLLVALFWFLTNRAWLAFLLPSALLVLVSFINYFKIAIRGDPLIAEDLLLIGEGAGTMGDYELHFPALFFRLLRAGARRGRSRSCAGRAPASPKAPLGRVLACWPAWRWGCCRGGCGTATRRFMTRRAPTACSTASASRTSASPGLALVVSALGQADPAHEAGGATATRRRRRCWRAMRTPTSPPTGGVNVVVTMLESFSDLSALGGVTFERDPYADFHALQAESYCGTLISDTNGGGTINAERSFLTGFAYPHPRYRCETSCPTSAISRRAIRRRAAIRATNGSMTARA